MSRLVLVASFFILLVFFAGASAQNYLVRPTAAVYDQSRDCFFVTNQSTGTAAGIVKIDSLRQQSFFNSGQYTRCTGLFLRNDTLFMETATQVILFDAATGAVLAEVTVPGAARLYSIVGDDSGYLYLSDYSANVIFKLRIGTWESSVFVPYMYIPCGLYYQQSRNRLIVASGAEQSIISAVDLDDSTVSQLIGLGLGDLDRFTDDDEGNLYVSDWANDVIYRLTPDITTPAAVVAGVPDPSGICLDRRRKEMLVPLQMNNYAVYRDIPVGCFNRVWRNDAVTGGVSSDARGVAWADFDGDGRDDLFVSHSGTGSGLPNALFRNKADGTFERQMNGLIATDIGLSQTSTWADYDNNGAIDCFVANGPSQNGFLYSNIGGGIFQRLFTDPVVADAADATAAGFSDYDGDSRLDLFVARTDGSALFRNTGSGFENVTSAVLDPGTGAVAGVSWGDFDNDCDPDLYLAFTSGGSGSSADRLYRNSGGSLAPTGNPPVGADATATYGGSWGDFDNDGDLDLFVPASGDDFLYRNNGDGSFTAVTDNIVATSGGNSYGSCWADLDNDGHLDLFVANTYSGEGETGNFLFWNNGNGTFSREAVNQIATDTAYAGAVASADYDGDGDVDLFVTQSSGRANMFYRNNLTSGNWIEVKLLGRQSNAPAIGAHIRVKATINGNPVWQMREVSSQTGYGAQSSLTVHFGLGDAFFADSVVIEWPSGVVNLLENVEATQLLTVAEICCQGRVGDANGSGEDMPTIGDISVLIDAKFITGTCDGIIGCIAEADINQSGGASPNCEDLTIGDISMLIDDLFITGEPPFARSECL